MRVEQYTNEYILHTQCLKISYVDKNDFPKTGTDILGAGRLGRDLATNENGKWEHGNLNPTTANVLVGKEQHKVQNVNV